MVEPRWLADLARFRSECYGILGFWFSAPPDRVLGPILDAIGHLSPPGAQVRSLPFHATWETFLQQVAQVRTNDASCFSGAYGVLFDPYTGRVPLAESRYVQPDAVVQCEVVAAIEHAYSQNGIRATTPHPPDHLSCELSFASLLCALEADAWDEGDITLVCASLAQQRSFLADHLCRWVPLLNARLARHETGGIYVPAARAAWAVASHDRDMAEFLLAALREGVRAG
ncbi:MAG: hypothetical protein Kow0010_22580 [Dehalococcoidia bacterium]